MKKSPLTVIALRLTVALAVAASATTARATPYATSLTNNAGIVSFRLNQTLDTNDTMYVLSSGDTVTNFLQLPGATVVSRGLITTNLGIAAGNFKVYIKHTGSGVISTNSPRVLFGNATINGVRGIAANANPASPYFGRIYIANSQTNLNLATSSRGDGLFAFSADLGSPTSDILGQGNAPRNGGYDFGSVTIGVLTNQQASSPFKVSVAPDDSVLVSDWGDATGNLIALDPDLTSFTYVLKQLQGTAASPVGSNNNHGSLSGAFMVGTGANRVLYTSDEDYQTDPAAGAATEWNSIWRYDIGNGPLPWTNAPNRKIMTPYLASFAGQNQKVQVVGNYLYANQRRSNFPQHDVYVVDLNNLRDPATFTGVTPWGTVWNSQDESIAEGYSNDVLRDTMSIAVSPDGKWFAAIIAGSTGVVTAPDGSTFTYGANDVIVCPLTNGIPHLAARQRFAIGGASLGRDVAFDAAHNLYWGSSGLACVQGLDIGESTEATTSSDGTFSLVTPATQVSVSPSTPVAFEQGTVPGEVTITRTAEDIGNPLTVFYAISGSASNGVDYTLAVPTMTNRVTLAAGQASTNITITPIDDSIPELSETAVLTIQGSGGYSVGFPLSALVAITDNETPQLRVASLSTNIYQGNSNDYAALVLTRYGDTNTTLTLDAGSFAMGGTAVLNVDYYLANLPLTINAGVVNYSNVLIKPIAASTAVGAKTIVLDNLPGTGYTVTNNTATTTLQLKTLPAGTLLYSNNFESDSTGTAWSVFYGSLSNAAPDFNVVFDYDYAAGGVGNLPAIPPAPHSTSGDTKGLYMTVNKSDAAAASAGLNLYLKNRSFGSNFALRFDMFLVQNSGPTLGAANQSKNETALFGINHSGTRTNWIRNSVPGTGTPKFDSDGLFCSVEEDAFTTLNFAFWSGPTWTNTVAVIGPTNFLGRLASTTREVFKKPPFDAGPALGGVPANTILSGTPTWTEVELSQNGNLLTWKINNTVVLQYFNTNAFTAPYTNGAIMLGYNDPWDDIGNQSAGSGEACVIYDNVKVVSISPPTILTHPSNIVAAAGTTTNLLVVASTVTGVTNYQWLRNGTNVVGATNATLNFSPLALANFGGNYSVVVSDGAYTTVSANATVLPPVASLVINTQPTSRVALVGSTLIPAFSVTASTASGRTNYQWFTNAPTGGVIANRTSATLNLTNLVAANFRPYYVTVSDGFNPPLTSSVVNLTIAVQPGIASSLSGDTLNLTFPTEVAAGLQYVVEWKGELTNGAWTPLQTNAGNGNPVTANDSILTDVQRFYRVRIQ